MAISQAMVTSFKVEILDGVHNFGSGVIRASTAADTFKLALYDNNAAFTAATTAYTATDEVGASGSYSGAMMTSVKICESGCAIATVTLRLAATTPPNAETGSQACAFA